MTFSILESYQQTPAEPVDPVQRPGATRLTGGVLHHYITANFSTRQNLVAELGLF